MAQRGGSVFSNIRMGSYVEAPMTADSKCDVLVAVEPSEGLRNIQYLNKNSTVVLNIRKVIPSTVSMGKSTYPEIDQILASLSRADDVSTVDDTVLAEKAVTANQQRGNAGYYFGSGKMPISM
jgi:indolepyruvate ferredoxin oxidoreductase beta subunit